MRDIWFKDLGTSARVGLAETVRIRSEHAERSRVVGSRVIEGHQKETLGIQIKIWDWYKIIAARADLPLNPLPDKALIVTSKLPSFSSCMAR